MTATTNHTVIQEWVLWDHSAGRWGWAVVSPVGPFADPAEAERYARESGERHRARVPGRAYIVRAWVVESDR